MDLNKLKYHPKWLEFGFITEEAILKQNIEFDTGEDPHQEHYRYRSFKNWIKSKVLFETSEIENLVVLVELDENQVMASSIIGSLFDSKKLTEEQYGIVKSQLSKYGNWALKKIERVEFSKRIRKNPDSIKLFEECIASKDNRLITTFIVHSTRRDLVEKFTTNVYSRKIRNLANQRLRKNFF